MLSQMVVGPQFQNFMPYVAFSLGAGPQKILKGTLKVLGLHFKKDYSLA